VRRQFILKVTQLAINGVVYDNGGETLPGNVNLATHLESGTRFTVGQLILVGILEYLT
jgi:hypothetical protein